MSIDLGNTPVGTPPTTPQQQQIRAALGAVGDAPIDGEKYVRKDGQWVYLTPPPNRAYDVNNIVLFEEASDIIPDSWAPANADVTRVVFKSTLTTIGAYAFAWDYNLTNITIPDSVTSIGSKAFYATGHDATAADPENGFTMGNGVTTIGAEAFEFFLFPPNTSLNLNNVTDIGAWCFASGYGVPSNIVSVNFGSNLSSLGDHAFQSVNGQSSSSLQSVTFDPGCPLATIPAWGFYGCTTLQNITIPDSVTIIGSSAFYYCIGLQSITIPDSVTSIGSIAFGSCEGLTSVTIGSGITSIGVQAFIFCTSLVNVQCLAMVAPTGDGEIFLATAATEIHVPVGATGYDTTFGGLTVVQDL